MSLYDDSVVCGHVNHNCVIAANSLNDVCIAIIKRLALNVHSWAAATFLFLCFQHEHTIIMYKYEVLLGSLIALSHELYILID